MTFPRARLARRGALLLAVLLSAGSLWAQTLPRARGFVNDFANVIPSDDERRMEAIISAVRDQTGAEIAVVTVESISPYPTIEDYGIALADEWQVGSEANDDGVILIVTMQEREVRIEVGYGLEGAIPDGKAGAILDDYVLPSLRQGDYGTGLANGVAVLAQEIADEYGVTLTNVEAPSPVAETGSGSSGLGNLFYIFILVIFFGGRWFLWPLLFVGRRGFFGGGFGSSGHRSSGFGGGGGSFGGFGGGGFGGGGASRGF